MRRRDRTALRPSKSFSFRKYYFIPFWPQPNLIPRDPRRKDRFENIAVFGYGVATEFLEPSFQRGLNELGLRLVIASRHNAELWSDYSDIDAVLADRAYYENNKWQAFKKDTFDWKPASKLINAWHAGVPAVLGPESAYRAERRSELDYIEVDSLDKALNAFRRLRDDIGLRHRMVENGRIRARETSAENMVKKWEDFIINVAVPSYRAWCAAPAWRRKLFFIQCDFGKMKQLLKGPLK